MVDFLLVNCNPNSCDFNDIALIVVVINEKSEVTRGYTKLDMVTCPWYCVIEVRWETSLKMMGASFKLDQHYSTVFLCIFSLIQSLSVSVLIRHLM